jgi:hypothetical protein
MAAPTSRPSSSGDLGAIIDGLDITPFQKQLLRQRWLDQVAYMGRKARQARRRYSMLRAPVIFGGVLIPGLISVLLAAGDEPSIPWLFNVPTAWVRLVAFAVSLGVAALAAAEESYRYAEQWRHYRRTAELLKTLGWQFVMLNGAFRRYRTHADAFVTFTERVEDTLNEDVEGYLSAVTAEGGGDKKHDIIA